MASSVSEEIQSRLTGHLAPAFCITHRWMSSPSWPASPQLIIISASCISFSMMWNCFSIPLSLISLIPKRGGIMGSVLRLHVFHEGVYSCGSFRVHKCPNVQVTWYPFPSMYPSFRFLAPSTSAMSRATLGFSAMQTIMVFLSIWGKITQSCLNRKIKSLSLSGND